LAKECQLEKHGNFDYLTDIKILKNRQSYPIFGHPNFENGLLFRFTLKIDIKKTTIVFLRKKVLYENRTVARYFYELSFMKII